MVRGKLVTLILLQPFLAVRVSISGSSSSDARSPSVGRPRAGRSVPAEENRYNAGCHRKQLDRVDRLYVAIIRFFNLWWNL